MKNLLFTESKNGHSYFLNTGIPMIGLCNPLLTTLASSYSANDKKDLQPNESFYKSKLEYLKSHIDSIPNFEKNISFLDINPSMILDNIVNLNQIVFEVTDACNLKCKYCGYGEFYNDYDERKNQKMDISTAISFLKYLENIWDEIPNNSVYQKVYISFYGGEPLLNMPLIEKIVGYCEKKNNQNRKFIYSMTTNAMLLNKYMDFIAEHNFALLISLDGNESGHSYRVDKYDNSTFNRVVENINLLKERYPDYFKKNVNFNAVLHNKNSISEIYDYIYSQYNKSPRISSLNDSGIRPDKVKEFWSMYKNVNESLNDAEHYSEIEKNMFLNLPEHKNTAIFLKQYSGYVFESYNSLFVSNSKLTQQCFPTGTCSPFSKKIFFTVNGKILPCERIGQHFSLGYVNENNEIILNFEDIAQKYNNFFSKLKKYCNTCFRKRFCIQCIYYIEHIDDDNPVCHGYMNKDIFSQFIGNFMSFLEEHREDYFRIINEVTLT